jgi:hypothetical protein
MKRLPRTVFAKLLLSLVVILVLGVVLTGCGQPPMVKGNGEKVNLIENSLARSQPWNVIENFLKQDKLDEEPFTKEHDSVYFAEILHNRAEYYNIKTAFVTVEFENGEKYALNAFETVDYGIVYVDCAGEGKWDCPVCGMTVGKDSEGNLSFSGYTMHPLGIPLYIMNFKINDYLRMPKECRELYNNNLRNAWWEVEVPERTCWDKRVTLEKGEKLSLGAIPYKNWGDSKDSLEVCDEWEDLEGAIIQTLDFFSKFLEDLKNDKYKYYTEAYADTLNLYITFDKQYRSRAEVLVSKIKDAYLSSWKESDSTVKSVKVLW